MEDRGYEDKTLPTELGEAAAPAAEEGEEKGYKTVLDGVPRSRVWSVLSMVSGILSIVIATLCLFLQVDALPFVSLGLGAAAILFSLLSRHNLGYFDGMAVAGIITGAMGLVFGASSYFLAAVING